MVFQETVGIHMDTHCGTQLADIFLYTVVAGSGKVESVNQVNHASWMAVVTPTDRPKSVRNCCLIELFCGVVCFVILPF